MALIPLPDIKDYWSRERKTQTTFFGGIMSRDRFLQIFWMMHVGKYYHLRMQSGHQKNKESMQGDRTYRETVAEKFCAMYKHCNR
jgi:hypothetical protein